MHDNDLKTHTDYEYNHFLDELMQMRSKVNENLDQYQGKQIGKFGIIAEAFYEDTGIKVRIKDLGLIEFETDDFFQQVKQAIQDNYEKIFVFTLNDVRILYIILCNQTSFDVLFLYIKSCLLRY